MTFEGQRVLLSRNLVPPLKFDELKDILTREKAEVLLCCNPSYNSENDFHVLASGESEKFAELQRQGCNVIGPECILQSARERRRLPNQKYTCCTCMAGMRILASGFDSKVKAKLRHMISAMCGELCNKTSMDIDIVIAKDVLAPKYKWSAFTLRKPIVSMEWVIQSYRQHHRASHEYYKLPIFAGLKVCATGILVVKRDKMADIIVKNGGFFTADLTKDCTHLIAKSTDSDKYKVAKQHWHNIKLVKEEWFWQSVAEKVCLEENSFAAEHESIENAVQLVKKGVRGSNIARASTAFECVNGMPEIQTAFSGPALTPPESTHEQICSPLFPDPSVHPDTGLSPTPMQQNNTSKSPHQNLEIAEGVYLSGCRIFLAGFEPGEMRRLVNMVLDGGGTRLMEFCDKITHVVLGKPSEGEMKDIRQYAMWGAVHVVMPTWLEECTRQRKEMIVNQGFSVSSMLFPRDVTMKQGMNKSRQVDQMRLLGDIDGWIQRKEQLIRSEELQDAKRVLILSEKLDDQQCEDTLESDIPNSSRQISQQSFTNEKSDISCPPRVEAEIRAQALVKIAKGSQAGSKRLSPLPTVTSSFSPSSVELRKVFHGFVFGFASSCEPDMRSEIVQWVMEGEGVIIDGAEDPSIQSLDFFIAPHGTKANTSGDLKSKIVTPQWIKSCLEGGRLLDIRSHVLFQPLPCDVPLSGFERLKFCVSQYAERERVLLHNLCHVLGAKYQENKMTKRASHLLCKVGDGDKYEAALKWGIEVVNADWVYACVAQNMVVPLDQYRVKRLSAADREAGLAIPTQYPTESPFLGVSYPHVVEVSTQEPRKDDVQGQNNYCSTSDVKGKIGNTRTRVSAGGRLHSGALDIQPRPNNQLSTACSLSSQMPGGNLDPWDELTASWSNEQAPGKRPVTRSQQKAGNSQPVLFDSPMNPEQGKTQPDPCSALRSGVKHEKICRVDLVPGDHSADNNVFNDISEEAYGTDVAAAIEGLLAQTSKVQHSDGLRNPDDRSLLSPPSTALNRRNNEDDRQLNFKRRKLLPNRCNESSPVHPPRCLSPAEDGLEKLVDSEMYSQVVAYNEDFSPKERIMERVRTRSMCNEKSAGSGGNAASSRGISWKNAELGRLFTAASANKEI